MKNIKLVATDLDGTFLRNDRTVSEENIDALKKLGEQNILRVAATGRNLNKVSEVLNEHVPFDYIVFSSGAGIYNWNTKQHMYQQNVHANSAQKLLSYFIGQQLNFHAFYPVPQNHKHYYYRGATYCEEFERYFEFNKSHAEELNVNSLPGNELCQFLLIIREDENLFDALKQQIEALCSEIRVIRASSPISEGYIWIEIFHKSVSKGNGIKEICRDTGVKQNETLGLGNDYNDFDLLDFTHYSYLTENAPKEIKTRYPLVVSNENHAFAKTVEKLWI